MPGTYKPFFTIELLHNYFADNKCGVINVMPDEATSRLLSRLKVKWRQVGNKVYFLILSTSNIPFIAINPDMVLRFGLTVSDYRFFNYTNLYGKVKEVYAFDNRVNNVVTIGGSRYLSKAIPAYTSANYQKGQLCMAGSDGNIYEAIQNASTSSGAVVAEPSAGNSYQLDTAATSTISSVSDYCWYNRGNTMAFVTEQDLIEAASFSYSFQLTTPALSTTTVITAFNPLTGAYDIVVAGPAIYQVYKQEVSSCNVALQGLPAGRYKITVNAEDKYLFVDNGRALTAGLGVIEVYANPVHSTYKLLAADGTLNSPVYSIQFANRLIYWKYIPRISTAASDTAVSAIAYGNIAFNTPGTSDATSGSSTLMIPLLEGVYVNTPPLTKEYPRATGPPQHKLPMAQVEQISLLDPTVTDPAEQQYVSENYLNY